MQALSVTQGLARSQSSNARNLLPVLQVLKMLAMNGMHSSLGVCNLIKLIVSTVLYFGSV